MTVLDSQHVAAANTTQPSKLDADLDAAFLQGGEMGKRLRRAAATPLGGPSTWSPALRQSVMHVLGSVEAQVVFWGPRHLMAYNDLYAALIASQHPQVAGQAFCDYFSEVAEEIGAILSAVRQTGVTQAFDDMPLNYIRQGGYLQETVARLVFQPIREQGQIAGVLATASDVSRRAIGERRMATLQRVSLACASAQNAREAANLAVDAVAQNAADVPASLVYLTSENTHCIAHHGLQADSQSAVDREATVWQLDRVQATQQSVSITALPTWLHLREPLTETGRPGPRALALPLKGKVGELRGCLVTVLNPLRPFDDDYQSFLELVAEHLGAAMQRAEALRESQRHAEALQALDCEKTAFFSNVSHEFRTPLTLILNPVGEALQSRRDLSRGDLQLVHRNALRLSKLVNALLDFARVEAGRAAAVRVPTDLGLLTTDIASTFRSVAERAGVAFDVRCDPISTSVDRDMWEKILLNLLSNAFKHTFAGGIAVKLCRNDTSVELSVRDDGSGIPAAHLPHVFERFTRVEGVKSHGIEGSGIGLSLTRELCRLHGGDIRVISEEGHGTTFTVTLPLADGEAREVTSAESMRASPYVAEALQWFESEKIPTSTEVVPPDAAHVLVVDDNADMRAYLLRLLQTRWHVHVASNGQEALTLIRKRRLDLILCDVMMPGLDGLGLLRQLRDDAATQALPIILLSARSGEDATITGLDSGADDYLAKPFSPRELVARVEAHLALAVLRNQALEQARQIDALARGKAWAELLLNCAPMPILLREPAQNAITFANRAASALGQGLQHAARANFTPEQSLVLGDREFLVSTEHVDAAYGQPALVVLAFKDVTALRAALRARDEFISVAMHELHTPLTPILLQVANLQRKIRRYTADDVEQAKLATALEKISSNVHRLTNLLDDLIDVANLQGGVRLRPESASLREIIEQQIVRLGTPVALHADCEAHGEWDLSYIGKAVRHLLHNAVKFGEGRPIEVVISARGSGVTISVRDFGIGVAPADQQRIFGRFERAVSDRKYGGLGLGLWIARNIVEASAGALSVASKPGAGALFTIRLPQKTCRNRTLPSFIARRVQQ